MMSSGLAHFYVMSDFNDKLQNNVTGETEVGETCTS